MKFRNQLKRSEKLCQEKNIEIKIISRPRFNYRLGFNTQLGRKTYAHYIMMWKSLLNAKYLNASKLDLGGLLLDQTNNLYHFKRGLGGKILKLIGIFG